MPAIELCPCCGHPKAPEIPESVRFTAMEQKVYLTLRGAGTAGLTQRRLMDKIYADRIDGGAEYNTIGVYIYKLRKKLKSAGIGIETSSAIGYRLIALDEGVKF